MMGAFLFSCTPDKYEIFDFEANPAQVDSMDLVPNSHILYADGVSELNIQILAYNVNQVWRKEKITLPDGSLGSKDSLHTDVYKVQLSRLTNEVEFYKEDGTRLPENARISTTTVEDFKVYAKIGDKQSELFQIDVREPFPEKEKKVIPVIFHVLQSEGIEPGINGGIRYTSALLKQQLDEANIVFSQRGPNISNSANPNIEFKMAMYAPDGTKLEEEGINRQSTPLAGGAMKPFLVEHTWDPKKYMNIYICTYPPSNKMPHTLLNGMDTLAGLSIETLVTAEDPLDLSVPENSGIIIGAYNWGYWYFTRFNWKTSFPKYLGLFSSRGMDYCDDTYEQSRTDYSTIEGWVRNTLGFLFFPTNVMGHRGSRSVFTGEQVERMHWVLENCPTHWAWKSDFAFTGVE